MVITEIFKRYTYENAKYSVNTYKGKEKYASPVHWHEQFELVFVVSGHGFHTINNKEFAMKAGSTFLLSPADFHGYTLEPEHGEWEIVLVNFSFNFFHARLSAFIAFGDMPLGCNMEREDAHFIRNELLCLSKELDKQEYGYDIIAGSRIESVITMLLRRIAPRTEQGGEDSSDLRLRDAVFYIHANFREDITLENAAKAAFMSPSHFSRLFVKFTGQNFSAYVRRLRLEFAKNLMENSAQSVTDACFESGFNSLSYFSKEFKRMYGQSPEKYRNKDLMQSS